MDSLDKYVTSRAIQVLRNTFFREFDPHPPPHSVKPYTFVTLFSGKADTPSPPHGITNLRNCTLEWPPSLGLATSSPTPSPAFASSTGRGSTPPQVASSTQWGGGLVPLPFALAL